MLRVDINADLGESFGAYYAGHDDDLLRLVRSGNIACGLHAGDFNVMADTVRAAIENGIWIGAHPGLPDLQGFGRRTLQLEPDEVYHCLLYQLGALSGFTEALGPGLALSHVKPHGALYSMAEELSPIADAIARAVADFDKELILIGQSGGVLVQTARDMGLFAADEVFADRTYQPDGRPTPIREARAMIEDPVVVLQRMIRLINHGTLVAVDGTDIEVAVDTICVQGETPVGVDIARILAEGLPAAGIIIKGLREE